MWLVPEDDLSTDQTAALDQSTSKNRVIIGGPGSGKTLVLAHRCKRLIDGGLARSDVRMLVYTNVLRDYISAGLELLALDDVCFTFDKWCVSELKALDLPVAKGNDCFARRRQDLRKALERREGPPRWEALIVDEGQDFGEDALTILRLSARHVTLAMDVQQELHDTGTSVASACDALGVRQASASLLSAYRCTPYIVSTAAEYLPTPTEREQFRNSNLMPIDKRETPVLATFKNQAGEWEAMAKTLRDRILANQRTAVLVRTNTQIDDVVEAMSERGLELQTRNDGRILDEDVPVVLTFMSAKGLTFDSVLLPLLGDAKWVGDDDEAFDRLMFVATTRATHWVWLSTVTPEPDFLDRLEGLIDQGHIVRQESGASRKTQSTRSGTESAGGGASPPGAAADPLDDLDDLL